MPFQLLFQCEDEYDCSFVCLFFSPTRGVLGDFVGSGHQVRPPNWDGMWVVQPDHPNRVVLVESPGDASAHHSITLGLDWSILPGWVAPVVSPKLDFDLYSVLL